MAAVTPQSSSGSTSSCELACLEIFEPVCASNGETFGNACEFNRTRCTSGDDTLEIVSQGLCPSASGSSESSCLQEFACLAVFTPVCGSDGQTYSNECFLRRAQCSDPTLMMSSDGECSANSSRGGSTAAEVGSGGVMDFASSMSGEGICTESVCTKELVPLCGSDGVTYGNECLLQNAQCTNSSLTLAFEGECGTSSTSTSGSTVGSDAAISSESASSETDGASTYRRGLALISVATMLLSMLAR